MASSMTDLRGHLFRVIERLQEPDVSKRMDRETAETICLAAKRLLESAEVEIKVRNTLNKAAVLTAFLAEVDGSNISEPTKRISR